LKSGTTEDTEDTELKRTIKLGSGACYSGIDLVDGLPGSFIFGAFGVFGGY
jgi:hypothetical protein